MIDHVSRLTLNELSEGSRLVKADLLYCINYPGHVQRYEALAVAAWLIERKDDRTVKLDDYRALTADQLAPILATPEPGDEDEDPVEDDEPEDRGLNPLDPTRPSSS